MKTLGRIFIVLAGLLFAVALIASAFAEPLEHFRTYMRWASLAGAAGLLGALCYLIHDWRR